MRVVIAFFALEIHRRITSTVFRRLARAILGLESFHRGPGFDQCAIHGKMIRGRQLFPTRPAEYFREEGARLFR